MKRVRRRIKKHFFILAFVILCLGIVWWNNAWFSFMYQAFKKPHIVGAPSPCSAYVAYEIVHHFCDHNKKLRILEVGGGTGALTRYIVQALKKNDYCDVVEIDAVFCEILREKFGNNPHVTIQHTSILEWQPLYMYDVIVCSLPFNIFPPHYVQKLLDHMQSLLKQNGIFSYIELMWLTQLKMCFVSSQKRYSIQNTLDIMKNFREQNKGKTVPIYLNFTPLYVHHITLNKVHT